jgi:Holliday junction resolvase RusA-like endonuclease
MFVDVTTQIPSINAAYHKRTGKGKGFYLDPKVSLFKNVIASSFLEKFHEYNYPVFETENIIMEVHLFYKRKGRDIDAPIKFIMDALEKIIYKNDKQVMELHIKKTYGEDKDRLTIDVREL